MNVSALWAVVFFKQHVKSLFSTSQRPNDTLFRITVTAGAEQIFRVKQNKANKTSNDLLQFRKGDIKMGVTMLLLRLQVFVGSREISAH